MPRRLLTPLYEKQGTEGVGVEMGLDMRKARYARSVGRPIASQEG